MNFLKLIDSWNTDNFTLKPSIYSVIEFLQNNFEDLSNDKDLQIKILDYLQQNKIHESKTNKYEDIKDKLEDIYDIEQKNKISEIIDWNRTKQIDRNNWIFVESLLKREGWLGISKIGLKANNALFLILQKQTLNNKQRWILELKKSVDKGESLPDYIRLLEDSIQLDLGKSHIYQTQFIPNRNSKFYSTKSKIKNIKKFSLIESFSKLEIEKIKDINSEVDIDKFDLFYTQLKDLNLIEDKDFQLSETELMKEKVSDLLSKIRDFFKDIKTIDLVLYLEILISMNTSNLGQSLITPVVNNTIQNIITQNEIKQCIMTFSEFLLEKKLQISLDNKNLIKLANLVIDSLFKVDNKIHKDMIKSILFKNKKKEDSVLFYRMLDAIQDVEKNPQEFFYCLGISNCHTISNLKNLGELNAREIRYITNNIIANKN